MQRSGGSKPAPANSANIVHPILKKSITKKGGVSGVAQFKHQYCKKNHKKEFKEE
jgi:hypothetical protein